jgi:tetratricopeptide (TPR) repeat protein
MFDHDYLRQWERRLLTAPLDAEARFPLAVIVGELAGPDPGSGRLSWACVCVADWALGRGAQRAALAFAEAAARAAPEHPRYAWVVGRLMRSHGDPRGAERWLRRALRLAIARRDWEAQARALSGLGNLSVEVGRYPEAKDFHGRALRVSRRWRMREQEGMALHDLFVIAIEEGDRVAAEGHARGALAAYGDAPGRVARLAHDVAYWWMVQGYFDRALAVFQALRPQFPRPDDALRLVASMGRAAGGSGDAELFAQARAEAEALIDALHTREALAPSLLELAHGAAALGDQRATREIAQAAVAAAHARGEADVRVRAEALTEGGAATGHVLPRRRASAAGASGERLAQDLVAALARVPVPEPGTRPWHHEGDDPPLADAEAPAAAAPAAPD